MSSPTMIFSHIPQSQRCFDFEMRTTGNSRGEPDPIGRLAESEGDGHVIWETCVKCDAAGIQPVTTGST